MKAASITGLRPFYVPVAEKIGTFVNFDAASGLNPLVAMEACDDILRAISKSCPESAPSNLETNHLTQRRH